MASRSVILPLVMLAVVFLGGMQAFAGNAAPTTGTQTSLRAGVASRALPLEVVESSMNTALSVQTAGWWANIFFVCIPCGFLMTLYLQSERSKLED
mmetsp:Transcript_10650/g.24227  ORF Transcript_10650/g.24227 Transcript_10650/m.24227 type:complete len:96 (-) Transcript_10650:69-356(-)